MQDIQEMLRASAQRVFDAHAYMGVPPPGLEERLWRDLAEIGLPTALATTAAGGAGLSPRDALPLLHTAGSHAVSVPLADTMVAHWIAGQAGLALPDGPIALGPIRPDEAEALTATSDDSLLQGNVSRVGWARTVAALVLVCGPAHAPRLVSIETPASSPGVSLE